MRHADGTHRVGRVARWQRRCTYVLLGLCALTGIVWFVGLDALAQPPSKLIIWWVTHGITGLLAFFIIGAALPHHVLVSWRQRRNRLLGGVVIAGLGLVVLSVLALLYGSASWHDVAHWVHVGIGTFALLFAFPLHVVKGQSAN